MLERGERGRGGGSCYVVVGAEAENDFAVEVAAFQSAGQVVVGRAEHGGEHVGGGEDLSVAVSGFVSFSPLEHFFKKKGAASMGLLHTTLASMKAYSKSGLPWSNWSRRNDAFCRSVYSAMWTARSGGRCARCSVHREAICESWASSVRSF